MTVSPRVSLIVSSHNRPLALRLLLTSLQLQTELSWETIVTDNSDKENAYVIQLEIERVDDPRIRYIYTGDRAANCYCSADMAVPQAKGEWLGFPSDDGYYCPWYLERMLRCAQQHGPSTALVYCNVVLGSAAAHPALDTHPRCCEIDKTTFLVRRDWFERVGGFGAENVGLPAPSDGLFIEKLIAQGIDHAKVGELLCVHN